MASITFLYSSLLQTLSFLLSALCPGETREKQRKTLGLPTIQHQDPYIRPHVG